MPNQVHTVLSQQRLFGAKLTKEALTVQRGLFCLFCKFRSLIKQESGQDLVEYALVIALIALAATVGMKSLAGGIKGAFGSVSVSLSTDV